MEITDPSVFEPIERTLGVACKCLGVCVTLLGQPTPNYTRSVSQTRIFRKPVRYTVSDEVSFQKVKHPQKSKKTENGEKDIETFPAVTEASTRVPKASRDGCCAKNTGIPIG